MRILLPAASVQSTSTTSVPSQNAIFSEETPSPALSADQREAFVLHHVEGRSYAEMASLLGIREDRLRMRVHRARDAVRRELGGVYG